MALLSGTAAKVAIDLLRSGRAFEEGGIQMFERALKATQRGQVPEGAVSEFRKVVDALKASRAAETIAAKRLETFGPGLKPSLDVEDYIFDSPDRLRTNANVWDIRANRYKQESLAEPPVWRASDMSMTPNEAMQTFRFRASRDRSKAAIIDALINLFGPGGPR